MSDVPADFYTMTINDFLKIASSSSHVPGGGNVSAVVGALGASMGAMVASLTEGKKGYEEHQEANTAILKAFMSGIENLKTLTRGDVEAFDAYMKTFKLPKDTDEQKKVRAAAIEDGVKKATLAPMEICRQCLELMRESAKLAPFGNKGAISDCGVAAIILEGAIRAAMLSVDINLPSIKDAAFAADIVSERGRIFAEAEEIKAMVLTHMRARW